MPWYQSSSRTSDLSVFRSSAAYTARFGSTQSYPVQNHVSIPSSSSYFLPLPSPSLVRWIRRCHTYHPRPLASVPYSAARRRRQRPVECPLILTYGSPWAGHSIGLLFHRTSVNPCLLLHRLPPSAGTIDADICTPLDFSQRQQHNLLLQSERNMLTMPVEDKKRVDDHDAGREREYVCVDFLVSSLLLPTCSTREKREAGCT